MPRRKWCVSNLDKEKASELSAACSIDPFASLLLVSRGITSKEEVEEFFSSDAAFCDPFSIRDMDKAVERINRALEQDEKIAVYGDYDADGVTASSLLYLYLELLPSRWRRDNPGEYIFFLSILHHSGIQIVFVSPYSVER